MPVMITSQKTLASRTRRLRTAAWAVVLATSPAGAADTGVERIGIFDSRAVAYAYFWSEAGTLQRARLVADVGAAKQTGDAPTLRAAEAALRDYDGRMHLAVFSTAPASDALTALNDHLPAVLAEAGVSRLISRWDGPALAAAGDATQVDLTARLVAVFKLPTAKLNVIEEIIRGKPIPLERAEALWRAGKL